ncbi:MAG: sel1 repeat family protein [Candidatus Thioglobus sp.]|nr:sel1 repeat family protein [Candidatus Thioglobus sp.]
MPNSNQSDAYSADLASGLAAFDAKNFAFAYQLLAPLAAQGNAEALWRLGMMQMNGLGMVKNQPLGFENFMLAAQQQHGFAHHMIGVAYMSGEGVEKDINQAIKWFEKAANKFALPGAAYALGMLYEDGKEVEKDLEKAKSWYAQAEQNSEQISE